MTKSLSIFDLDHTLCRGNSSVHFGRHLYRRSHIHPFQLLQVGFWYACTKFLGMPLLSLHRRCFSLFRGRPRADLARELDLFLDQELDQILNPLILKELQQAQAVGHRTAILSNSPSFLVEAIGKRLGVDESQGTVYSVDHTDCLSSVVRSFEGKQKADTVRELAARWQIPYSNIVAYSDSHLDLPLLEVAGLPVAVDPDRKLRQIAKARQWTVMENRKGENNESSIQST